MCDRPWRRFAAEPLHEQNANPMLPATVTLIDALRPFVDRRKTAERHPSERCDICGAPLGEGHQHVLQIAPRAILCSCGPCAVLFAEPATSGARFRTIPDRVLVDPSQPLGEAHWVTLGIPVGLAFVVRDAASGQCTAFYPSPAGPVQTEIDPAAWAAFARSVPLAVLVESDVEALLVHRARGGGIECFVAPVDECFSLVGAIRAGWSGFDGGDDVRRVTAEFLARMRARSRPAAPEHGGPR
jgi:hypothetical protein